MKFKLKDFIISCVKLKIRDKILLHLLEFYRAEDTYDIPYEITQAGIAESVGISRTHVPREVKQLMEEGLIVEKKGRAVGTKKAVKAYFLSHYGFTKAREIREMIMNSEVTLGGEKKKVAEIVRERKTSLLSILKEIEREEKNLQESYVKMYEVDIDISDFVGREREIKILKNWIENGRGIFVVLGIRGVGKSTLVRKVIETSKPSFHILWIDLSEDRSLESIVNVFEKFSQMLGVEKGKDIYNFLRVKNCLIVFDNYYMVRDEVRDFLRNLLHEDIRGNSKIIVTMRSNTPFYLRFYSNEEIIGGVVKELTLDVLSKDEVRMIFNDIQERDLRTIYHITKGLPLTLKLLKNADESKLLEISTLSKDQIKLLLHILGKK